MKEQNIRLIDANALEERLYDVLGRFAQNDQTVLDMIYLVQKAPTITTAYREGLRSSGQWIEDDYAYNRCSECGYEFDVPEEKTPYCPHCGADMDSENENR